MSSRDVYFPTNQHKRKTGGTVQQVETGQRQPKNTNDDAVGIMKKRRWSYTTPLQLDRRLTTGYSTGKLCLLKCPKLSAKKKEKDNFVAEDDEFILQNDRTIQ